LDDLGIKLESEVCLILSLQFLLNW
jgi:hypothetical protein